ncbi:MAG: efflux RND transporter permease subunit [Acidobacteria bacterium]|uniref:Efflux RND transporter permease subunit n=1 Tax=Candidatus Polarisedimenticola svalbardensis TaxID=2886004 RepID=A0A8J6XWD9_9BACT|nr:efflux RND transporter permease subunit [Candidatus Polarisedimenticola svalbardensis]
MATRLIEWALNNRLFVILLTVLLIGGGLFAMSRLPIDAVPDVTNVQVQIVTSAPALGPLEAEQYLTYPVEAAMSGLPDVTELRSISRYGISSVTVVFKDGTPLFFARQLVQERLPEARENIPPGFGSPKMIPPITGLGEIFHFTVDSDSLSPMELRGLLDWQIAFRLRQVPGVVEVNAWGGLAKQFQVEVFSEKLVAHGIALADVFEAVEKNNAMAGSAYLERGHEQLLIRGEGLIGSIEDLEEVVVAVREGTPIRVREVARVVEGAMPRRGAATRDGAGEAVIGLVQMLAGENALEVTERVKERLSAIEKDLPAGVTIHPYYDRTELVKRSLKTVVTNLVEGGLLVVIVLLLLLGNLRGGLIVAIAIPLSMLFAFCGMLIGGISGNLMSLGAIDFGLVVDGSVVLIENVVRRLALRGKKPGSVRETVRQAAVEVGRPVTFAVAIIIIVYLPILTLTGTEGRMFRPMAWTVVFALAGSLLLSLTLMPVLASLAFRNGVAEREARVIGLLRRIYRPTLAWAFRARRLVAVAAIAAVAGAAVLFLSLGGEFLPTLDEGGIVVQSLRLQSSSMTHSVEAGLEVERVLHEFPEVEQIVTRIGSPEVATDVMGIELSDVFVSLKPKKEWDTGRTKEQLVEAMSESLEHRVAGMGFSFTQPIEMRFNELIAGVRSDVAVSVFGDDLDELERLGGKIAGMLREVPGAADVRADQIQGLPVLRIILDHARAARYGISVDEVLGAVEAIRAGRVVGVVMDGVRRYDIVVKFALPLQADLDAIRNLPVMDPDGHPVPLAQLAEIRVEEGPAQISREFGQRRLNVEANVRGRDLESFVREAQAVLEEKLDKPDGYYLEWGGAFEQLERSRSRLLVVLPIAMFAIFALLYGAFGSVRSALLIFTGVPLAAVGGVLALWVRGIPFSISAGVGFIALFGVAVLNGVVMVSAIRRLQDEGHELREAVEQGASERLRPVLMTALVASLGFLPMALSTSAGAEVQRPLATVVIGGLISSTVLTLILLPTLYDWVGKRSRPR